MFSDQTRPMPLNTYPLWKYALLVFVLLLGFFLALPNIFGEDPAIQLSHKKGSAVSQSFMDELSTYIKENQIDIKAMEVGNNKGLIRFNNTDDQSKAKGLIFQYTEKHDDANIKENIVSALNMAAATPEWLKGMGLAPMKLGLDLRGGVQFLIQVDTDFLLEDEIKNGIDQIKSTLRDNKIYYEGRIKKEGKDAIVATFKTSDVRQEAFKALNRQTFGYDILDTEADGRYLLTFKLTELQLDTVADAAVKKNITILNNRVNSLGVSEPVIQRLGRDRILVQLPGIQDSAIAQSIIGDTRTLSFRMVDKDADINRALDGRVPRHLELMKDEDGQWVLIKKKVVLDGEHIIHASVSPNPDSGMPQINVNLDGSGGNKMSQNTKRNVGEGMATVLTNVETIYKKDEKGEFIKDEAGNLVVEKKYVTKTVASIATIQSQFAANFRITGDYTPFEANQLALILKSGSLKAPINIIESRIIGASLGKDNIKKGMLSILVGFCAVLIFMLVRYKAFGMIANTVLILNLVLLAGFLSLINAVLTLPGMAGVLLTIGMAVDANVLIFERIKEELKNNVSPAQAIHNGFDKALSTIADANITTMIAALILFSLGSGPVSGFAITLFFGILTSMFTAIFASRAIINSLYGGKTVKRLMI